MNGTWITTAAELDGEKLPKKLIQEIKLELKDEKYKVTIGEQVDEGTVTLDLDSDPAGMEIKGTKGTEEGYMITEKSGENSGAFWLGRVGGPKSVTRANQLVAVGSSDYGGVFGWNYPLGGSYIFTIYSSREDDSGITASIIR